MRATARPWNATDTDLKAHLDGDGAAMVYQHTIHIDAPIGEVFEFFRDPGNFRRLHPGIEFTDITLTEDGVGTHYSWTSRVAGIKLAGCDVYTEFIPNRRITDRSSSALEGTWRYTFEAAGPGTQLTLSNQVRSFWALPPLRQLLDWMTAKTHGQQLGNRLKDLLEP